MRRGGASGGCDSAQNPDGIEIRLGTCMKEEREAEARDTDASRKIETDRVEADDPESAG